MIDRSREQMIPLSNPRSVPFSYLTDSFIVVPVAVNDVVDARFVLDTGIGLNLISRELCARLGCTPATSHRGRRMSGQEVEVPLSRVASLGFGNIRLADLTVGVLDTSRLLPGHRVDGFLSIGFFARRAFTIDYHNRVVIIDTTQSLRDARAQGRSVTARVDDQGNGALALFLPLTLPDGQSVSVEVDTGSQALILDERFMASLGVLADRPAARRVDGLDETGYPFVRYFSRVHGRVHVTGHPSIGEDSPDVMFQKIIYDGLVGQSFLGRSTVTFNLPDSEVIFRPPGNLPTRESSSQ